MMAIRGNTTPTAAVAGVALSFACYGGIMGNYPALTSAIFGLEHAGENYGFVMIGLVAGSMAAPLIRNALIGLGLWWMRGTLKHVVVLGG